MREDFISDLQKSSGKLIIIAGPTAVGKTAVSIEVAKQLGTVILSADSRQCYKELNIGVARPSENELAAVPHFFIASHSIHQKIDAAYYEKFSLNLLTHLFQTYNVVVVVGGTGLYIKALTEGLDEIPEIPDKIRESIIENYKTSGIEWLQQQLTLKDPLFTAQGEMQNPQRMMRALEVAEATGQSIINYRGKDKINRSFDIIQIGLEMPRELLNQRINRRVGEMIEAGLENEAKLLYPHRYLNALQTVGYKEMFDYFDGRITQQQAIELIRQNTRRYAKRQMTWFKKQAGVYWQNVLQQDMQSLTASILEIAG